MSQLKTAMREEAQLRYETARTVDDWKGCYAWAVQQMEDLRKSGIALENVLKQYVNYADDGVTEEIMKKYAAELNRLESDDAFKAPDFLNDPPEDPVFEKILKFGMSEEGE